MANKKEFKLDLNKIKDYVDIDNVEKYDCDSEYSVFDLAKKYNIEITDESKWKISFWFNDDNKDLMVAVLSTETLIKELSIWMKDDCFYILKLKESLVIKQNVLGWTDNELCKFFLDKLTEE